MPLAEGKTQNGRARVTRRDHRVGHLRRGSEPHFSRARPRVRISIEGAHLRTFTNISRVDTAFQLDVIFYLLFLFIYFGRS